MEKCFECGTKHMMLIKVKYDDLNKHYDNEDNERWICLNCLFHRMPKCTHEIKMNRIFPDYSKPWNKKEV
jgi:hypothetical protein